MPTAARAIWRGALAFGAVRIPVKLYTATREESISFNQLHKTDASRIRQVRVCSEEDEEVPSSDIVRGYEYDKDRYVVITDEDLEQLPLPTKHTIEVESFVPVGQVDPIYYEKSYYLQPEPTGEVAFTVLLGALAERQVQGIGKVTIREKERLCSLRLSDGVLMMATMRYHDEVDLDPADVPLPAVTEQELQMAFALIDMLSKPFRPEEYKDTYRTALLEVINAKLAGSELPVEQAPAATESVDLVAALQASVEVLRQRQQGETAAPPAPKRASRKKAVTAD